jgi:nucleoside-diphosphate-sugar epimerase
MIGPGTNLHHLIYIDDLLTGLFLAASVETAVGGTFVVAGKEALTTNEMVAVIAEQLGTSVPKIRVPLSPFLLLAAATETTLRPLGIQPPLHRRRMDFFKKSFVFSQEHARTVLGFVPQYGFREGVAETAKWYAEKGYL